MTHTNKCSGVYPRLNIPFQRLRLKEDNNIVKVYDPLRKKYFIVTPEEYVRQQFTSWLRSELNYPASLMANEIGIEYNGTKRRCDTVIFSPNGSRLMIIEYKAPDIAITQNVFDQIVRYNQVLKAKLLTVSNGISHFCCMMDYARNTYKFLPDIPDYLEIVK